MDEPKTETLAVEEITSALNGITEETTKEELHLKIDFLIKQLNLSYDQNKQNILVLTEALLKAQTLYKHYEKDKGSFKSRVKLFLKKVLIAWGWYEASYEELKEIHFGKTRNDIPSEGC